MPPAVKVAEFRFDVVKSLSLRCWRQGTKRIVAVRLGSGNLGIIRRDHSNVLEKLGASLSPD